MGAGGTPRPVDSAPRSPAIAGRAALVGFSPAALAVWVAFDALLCLQLLRSSLRPRRGRVSLPPAAAIVDAGISVPHLAAGGFGRTLAPIVLRGLAALAPCVGAAVLIWVALKPLRRSDTLRSSRVDRLYRSTSTGECPGQPA